uniref:Uncharacterized protein LOC111112629 isoform X7 n=1 Tax=Crassostrea virginica TaxID=6565 RepID=A0A8B8BRL1_CRAVI|nr:uncharacterized protein LOC111112629 isoform X7 [Crassostrea virginica]
MLDCRVKGRLVLLCLAIILRSNEHYGKVLAMGIVHRVRDCPRNETEWKEASNRLNCTSGDSSPMNKYHCLPADNRTTLLEFCYSRTRAQVVEGLCMVLVERKHILNHYNCSTFNEGCPHTWYFSDEMYKYPACFEIDPLQHCYKAEATCQPTTWSVTVLSDTTQSTLVNKTSNETTPDTHDREINPLVIIIPVSCGLVLTIAVLLTIVAWKKWWRRKRCFGRKENVQPEEKDEELELLGTANNVSLDALKPLILEMGLNANAQPEGGGEESGHLEAVVDENVQPEGDGEESVPLETEVNENAQPEGDGEEFGNLGTVVNENVQPEGDGEESGHLETEVNENVQPEGDGEESGHLETEVNENVQPEGDGEESGHLETELNENVQPEGDGEESGPSETEVNESAQPEGNGEESGHLETENDESAQPEGDGEESGHLEEELIENIERFGFNYLLQRLPSDQKKFPNIAKKLNIPHEILYWSLENREKFVKSMKAGDISVYNGRAMVIGCAYAGKTTLVKKIKGDSDLETTSTSGIEIHSHAFKLNSDESTIIVSTDEEKEKGCLCLAPGMLNILEENTQETSLSVNVNVVRDQSIVTSAREENNVVDVASRLPSSTEGTLNSNNDEVVDDTDPDVKNSIKPVNNLASNVNSPREENNVVDVASSLPSSTEGTLNSNNDEVVDDTDPDVNESIQPENVDLNDCVPSVNMENLKMLSLLDFAGHSAYYACHHIFFSPRAFFILVVDMTKDLSTVATEACTTKGLIYSNWTYADYIKYWLGSIHAYSSKKAPVILAVSHSEGADPKKVLQYFFNICYCLPKKLRTHLDKSRVFSFEKLSNKNVEDFKKCLVSTVNLQSHWGEKVPISWTKLESVLRKLKEISKVFPFSALLINILKTNDLRINNEEDLLNALMFFNDTGVILFRAEIKDIIILDVQWIVDAFKRIIFDEEHMEVMEYMSALEEFKELNEYGLLTSKVLNVLWRNFDFYQHKKSLVNHMKHLDMVAELSEDMWYVPCMNKQKFDSKILDNCNVSSRLCFLFEFLPFIIYHRLVAACINKMGMKPWKLSAKMCIFHTVTILTYKDDTHRVLIAICDNKESPHKDFPYSIEIQINVTKPREIDTSLTPKLKEDIFQNLTEITQGISSCELYSHVGYRCRLDTFGKNEESHILKEEEISGMEYDCSKCSQSHIVDVGSIRRFWEKDEPHAHLTESNAEPNSSSAKEEAHKSSTNILSDVGLMSVAAQLGAEWILVVGHLGLKQAEIEQIKLDNPYNTINQITIALQRWRDRQEGQADTILQQLLSALRSCDRTDLLDEIQERYNITARTLHSTSYAATDEMTNINRVSRLLMEPCTDQLRDLLRFYIPPAHFNTVIQTAKSRLPRLIVPQKLILPNSGVYSGKYDDMDISLLYILLRNVCGIQAHNRGWGNTPDSADRSVSANIERLRLVRNRCGHSTGGMSNAEFNQIWSEIRAAVVDLDKALGIGNKYQEVVDFIRNDTMDPTRDRHFRDQLLKHVSELENIKKDFHSLQSSQQKNNESNIPLHIQENHKSLLESWMEGDRPFHEIHSFPNILDKVQSQPVTTIIGGPGSGKTATACHLALRLQNDYDFDIVPVDDISEIKQYGHPKCKQVFILDDVIGVFGVEYEKLINLERYKESILNVLGKRSKILFTCRKAVYNESSNLKSFVLDKEYLVDLEDRNNQLNAEDRKQILNNHCKQNYILLTPDELPNVSSTVGCMMFPLLCKLFCSKPEYQALGKKFFENPYVCIRKEMDYLQRHKKIQYASLIMCMFCQNAITEIMMTKEDPRFMEIKQKVFQNCRVSGWNSEIKDSLDIMINTFTIRTYKEYSLIHDSVYEVLAFHYGNQHQEDMLEYMSSSFVAKKFSISDISDDPGDLHIKIHEEHYSAFAKRFVRDLKYLELYDVFMNKSLKIKCICSAFTDELEKMTYLEIKNVFFQKIKISSKMLGRNESRWKSKRKFVVDRKRHELLVSDLRGIKSVNWVVSYGHSQILQFLFDQVTKHKESIRRVLGWEVQEGSENSYISDREEQIRLLILGCYSGDVEVVKLLLKHCDVECINGSYYSYGTPLVAASSAGYVDIVDLLNRVAQTSTSNSIVHSVH